MGKATRWLKGLLGMKKEKDPSGNSNSNSTPVAADRKEKKRWSFAKSGRDSGQTPPPAAAEATWFRSYISDSEKEQNKHAIAVAAATAAAADAAVAAAQAAVAVVRLTSKGRGSLYLTGRDRWAAVKIQTIFRGYLVSLKKLQFFYFNPFSLLFYITIEHPTQCKVFFFTGIFVLFLHIYLIHENYKTGYFFFFLHYILLSP